MLISKIFLRWIEKKVIKNLLKVSLKFYSYYPVHNTFSSCCSSIASYYSLHISILLSLFSIILFLDLCLHFFYLLLLHLCYNPFLSLCLVFLLSFLVSDKSYLGNSSIHESYESSSLLGSLSIKCKIIVILFVKLENTRSNVEMRPFQRSERIRLVYSRPIS